MDDKNPLKMKVTELKAELGRRGLSQTGLKFDLAQRLQTAMDVDEFGALSSLSSPAQSSSSPLLPDPGKNSADHSDPAPRTPQTPSYEFAEGGPPDQEAQHLEIAAETKCSEAAPLIEQSCMGDASIAVDTTQSEGGGPPGTEDILALEEKPGCGEERRDQNKANIETDIASGEMKPAVDSGRSTVEHRVGDVGGSNKKIHGVEEYSATATASEENFPLGIGSLPENETLEHEVGGVGGSNDKTNDAGAYSSTTTVNEETPRLGTASLPENDKNNGTEEHVRGGDNTPLSLCDSTNPSSPPASPRKGIPKDEKEDKDQRGAVGTQEPDGTTTQKSGVQPDRSDQKKAGVKGDTTTDGANQGNKETTEGPSGLAAGSLLLSSLTDRMKDREERFRRESEPGNRRGDAKGNAGNGNSGPSKASGRGRGGKMDSTRGGNGGESGNESVSSSAESACPEVHEAQTQTVEDARRAKLMKRKERFVAPPSASSGNGLSGKPGSSPSGNLGNPLSGYSPRKVPSGMSGAETSGRKFGRQAASEAARKMARRSERFGAKGARCDMPREATPANVRGPRGSFFAEPEDGPEGNVEQSPPPPSGGYSFDPLPQRKKRARATTKPSLDNDGAPAKRTGADRGVANGSEAATSPDAAEERGNSSKAAAKTAVRQGVRFLLGGSSDESGVVASPLRREKETGKPSRPSPSSVKRASLDCAFILWGVKKKPAPGLSTTTTTAAGKRKGAPPIRLCRSGDDEVHGVSNHHHADCLDEEGKARDQSKQRGGPPGTAAPQAPCRHPIREERVEKKFAEQAAKMAERRKRFAEDPRAPSFR